MRVASGAIGNLMAFMATCRPGDAIIVPPAEIGGHVTHHAPGAAGLYGLVSHPAPVRDKYYSVDVDGLARLAREVRPKLITLGGSLNLEPHPVAEARAIVESSLPRNLSRRERRLAYAKRMYGDELPEAALVAFAEWPQD